MTTPSTRFDTLALERYVVHTANNALRRELADTIIERALASRNIAVPPKDSSTYRLLRDALVADDFPIERGRVTDAVVQRLDDIRETVIVKARVEDYAELNEIPTARFTPAVKSAMIRYLQDLGVQLDDDDVYKAGGYDEYLALSYATAIRTSGGSNDPIVAAATKSTGAPWDFKVKFFDDADPRSINRRAILSAGALDYTYYLGELLGVYAMVGKVVDLFDSASIDIEDEELQAAIENYSVLDKNRPTLEQRAMMYKRVLNLGNAKVMSGVVVNEEFPGLWHQLMTEVARYIEKREAASEEGRISIRPIVHAIEELQYNLSEFGSGGTAKQAQKLNAQLEDAMAILGHDEVVQQLAFGRRKGPFEVIKRLIKEETGKTVDVKAIKILAEEGNRVFQFIADYTSAVRGEDAEFQSFIDSAEAWILAEDSLAGGSSRQSDSEAAPESSISDETADTTSGESDSSWE